jgi:hypothetical protein
VFRVVIESRERGERGDRGTGDTTDGRMTPAVDGRTTPFRPQTPGGTRLMSKGGRCVQTSVLVSSFAQLVYSHPVVRGNGC